jgi:hypothetical protein
MATDESNIDELDEDELEPDPLIAWMRADGVPITRENYIALDSWGDQPEEWTSEDESALPPELQDWSQFEYDKSKGALIAKSVPQIDGGEKAFRVREKFDPDEPRDESGKWTDGGGGDGGGKDKPEGGGKEHPGPGYSASAFVKDGVIHTTSVYDAQRALHEDRKVELDQPRKVSILLQRLGDEAKAMAAKGKEAPNFNLCNVTVAGTNLFCADTKGIPRVEMPQLDKQQTKDFLKYLKDQGYKVEKDKVRADHLRATQNELNGAKVAATMDKIRDAGGKSKKIVVSSDDYILDGHHSWAAKIGVDAEDGDLDNDLKMNVARVNIPITKLLAEAEKFTGGKGHKPASESKGAGQILADMVREQLAREAVEPKLRAQMITDAIKQRVRAKEGGAGDLPHPFRGDKSGTAG